MSKTYTQEEVDNIKENYQSEIDSLKRGDFAAHTSILELEISNLKRTITNQNDRHKIQRKQDQIEIEKLESKVEAYKELILELINER